MNCTRCNLSQFRSNIVIGRGNPSSARIVLIGEAPGLSEDVLGEAFIGEAGKLLDEVLARACVPQEICFFTNTVLCRPCNHRNDREIRPPNKTEVLACIPNVMNIINSAKRAEYVIFVGRVAETYYANLVRGLPAFYLIHPSAILKVGGKASSLFQDAVNTLKKRLNLKAEQSFIEDKSPILKRLNRGPYVSD